MPIYEYRCAKCGRTWETLEAGWEMEIVLCVLCHIAMKRVLVPFTFVIK